MKKLILMLIVAFACAGTANAQGWLKKLGKVAEDAAKRTVENNVDRKTTEAVDDAMNPDESSSEENTSRSKKTDYDWDEEGEAADDTPVDAKNQKSDFVRGSVIGISVMVVWKWPQSTARSMRTAIPQELLFSPL